MTQCLDREWDRYYYGAEVRNPWKSVDDKSWRDPVVCVSYSGHEGLLRLADVQGAESGPTACGPESSSAD